MAEGNGEIADSEITEIKEKVEELDLELKHSSDYLKLIELELDEKVASKLDEIYQTGKLAHADLDERALDALKEFPVDGALNVLKQFLEANLEHVSNKSAYLCGVMKTYRQKSKLQGQSSDANVKGPDEAKLKEILDRTGYTLDVTTGQRKYGGPPPGWDGSPPGNGCEVFCGKVPKDIFEDELILLFERCGKIWDLRLMMDPLTGQNRGYAFVTFCDRAGAKEACKQLDNNEIKKGKNLKVNLSVPNLRLFVGSIPKSKGKEEIFEEFNKVSAGLTEVIIYSSPDDKKKNRGFCFLEYESHKAASLAKRRLSSSRGKVWGCDIIIDWADPQEEPDADTMGKVKVLYVRNLTTEIDEEKLRGLFEPYGSVERVKKIKDYGFVHFEERDHALKAMEELNGKDLGGSEMEVSLAKPPSDKKKKEELLRNRERRMMTMRPGPAFSVGRGGRGGFSGMRVPPGRDYDYDYDYYGYGEYRGGYSDPYYDEYYGRGFDEYEYYGYGPSPMAMPPMHGPQMGRGRGAPDRGRGTRGGTSRGRAGCLPTHGAPLNSQVGRGGRGVGGLRGRGTSGGRGGKGNLAGKRKFDGQNQGDSKRRFQNNNTGASSSSAQNWGNQPIPQQPLENFSANYTTNNASGGESQWYQDPHIQQWG
ncbi:Heterogeneous nuclear ribonucleoprotein Q [Nymphon striatum]|nr:Heterogeneous nuclear ribonucleoprotein Q [Nymphon striatum]